VEDGAVVGDTGQANGAPAAQEVAAEAGLVPLRGRQYCQGSSRTRAAKTPTTWPSVWFTPYDFAVGDPSNNRLYFGDNFDVLRQHIKDESVDLVYLDPPFNSAKDYNVLFLEHDGKRSAAQVKAFKDTWEWDEVAARSYQELTAAGGRVSQAMQAFRLVVGQSDMLAYLAMMAPRLIELHRVMKPTASIYLHCDPVASHYLKLLMDAVFRPASFRNEVIWRYRRWPTTARQFQKMHDVLLFYGKSSNQERVFNVLYGYEPLAESTIKTYGTKKQKADFSSGHRKPGTEDEESPGPPLSDVWEVGIIAPMSKERLGYPTQKPEKLLERVIRASSNPGDLVLDPFCGCGTAVAVAHRLKRQWIGIDVTHLAINLIKRRMKDSFGVDVGEVIGEPASLPDAGALAALNPYQFQWWALGLVGARPVVEDEKKGADGGIDGTIYFHDEPGPTIKTKQIIFSVKSGGVGVKDVRDLRGVIEREGAAIGVLITMQLPTQPMRSEAAGAGFYRSPGWQKDYRRIQVVTIGDLLEGRGVSYPPAEQVNVTFKKAPLAKAKRAHQTTLAFDGPAVAKAKPMSRERQERRHKKSLLPRS
jgi:site-specific DNA-methyltransferase (adenine-specific)